MAGARGMAKQDLRIYVSQEEKEPREGKCDASYFDEFVFFVHTNNKHDKTFDSNNIYLSFLSIKGCSINVRVKFTDLKGHRRQRSEKPTTDEPALDEEIVSDPFKELRRKMRIEDEKVRSFKLRMQQKRSDFLHELSQQSEEHKLEVAR